MLRFLKSSFKKIKGALSKTHAFFRERLRSLFGKPWDDATYAELEKVLYEADLGTTCTKEFLAHLRKEISAVESPDFDAFVQVFRDYATQVLGEPHKVSKGTPAPGEPRVVLIVGVNGSGKTTSLAKLGHYLQKEHHSVLLAAGDTYRAAAVDQLTAWAERLHLDHIKGKQGGDPSAVVFDALTAAKARNVGVVLIDTAGRLQNKADLMRELEKIRRVAQKVVPSAPHETLLVLDATMGQNAIDQARAFHSFTPLTGIILAKLDGSAKGGIILPIYRELGIPVEWIGTGEGEDDIEPFDKKAYVENLF